MNVDPIKMAQEKVENFKKIATDLFINDSSKRFCFIFSCFFCQKLTFFSDSKEEKQKLEDDLLNLAYSLKDVSEYYLDMNLHLTQIGYFGFIQNLFFDFSKIKQFFFSDSSSESEFYFYELLGVFLETIGSSVQNSDKVQKLFAEDLKFFPTILKFFEDLEQILAVETKKQRNEKQELEIILFKKRFLSCVNGFYTNIQQPVISEKDVDELTNFVVGEVILQTKTHFSELISSFFPFSFHVFHKILI